MLAFTILGVDFNEASGAAEFLILVCVCVFWAVSADAPAVVCASCVCVRYLSVSRCLTLCASSC